MLFYVLVVDRQPLRAHLVCKRFPIICVGLNKKNNYMYLFNRIVSLNLFIRVWRNKFSTKFYRTNIFFVICMYIFIIVSQSLIHVLTDIKIM